MVLRSAREAFAVPIGSAGVCPPSGPDDLVEPPLRNATTTRRRVAPRRRTPRRARVQEESRRGPWSRPSYLVGMSAREAGRPAHHGRDDNSARLIEVGPRILRASGIVATSPGAGDECRRYAGSGPRSMHLVGGGIPRPARLGRGARRSARPRCSATPRRGWDWRSTNRRRFRAILGKTPRSTTGRSFARPVRERVLDLWSPRIRSTPSARVSSASARRSTSHGRRFVAQRRTS